MLILDTDHLTAIDRGSDSGAKLRASLENELGAYGTTIVSVSEQLQGLLALIASAKREADVIERYGRLYKKLASLNGLLVLPWTTQAAEHFHRLRRERVRIGTMDWRIASIALANGATLLTGNIRDF